MFSQDGALTLLKDLDTKIRQCRLCPEREQFPGTLPTMQLGSRNDILFVGRDPAKEGWRKSGKAFYKTDGSMLQSGIHFSKQLAEVGMNIKDINFAELIKCFLMGGRMRNPKKSEIENCRRWLDLQIDILRPKVIVSMGKDCYEFFRGKRVDSFSLCIERGERVYYRGIPVVPVFHPSGANQKYSWKNVSILRKTVKEFGGD